MIYEITEEQIKTLENDGINYVKDWFPEVFKPKETPESFLDEIFNKDFICKTYKEKFPNSIFYFDGETCLLEIEKTEKKLYAWVNYYKIWNPIREKFGLDYAQIQKIMKTRIEEHFKLRDVTTGILLFITMKMIEEHFKLRDVTTWFVACFGDS